MRLPNEQSTKNASLRARRFTNTTDVSCHVAALVISPSTKAGTRSGAPFNYYSLLATAEEFLGLPKLGLAAAYPAMTMAFNP
jgi:hypothetical protein